LREVLEELDEVAELLDIAATQKTDQEKEIETLRRMLSQLQRAREQVRGRPPLPSPPPSGGGGGRHSQPSRRDDRPIRPERPAAAAAPEDSPAPPEAAAPESLPF
jgi:hypothetical protein